MVYHTREYYTAFKRTKVLMYCNGMFFRKQEMQKSRVLNSVYSMLPFQSKGAFIFLYISRKIYRKMCILGGELSALGNRDRREMTF